MSTVDDGVSTMMVVLILARRAVSMLPYGVPKDLTDAVTADLEQACSRLRWWQAERDLNRLLAHSNWAHPAQILPQPYASFEDMLHVLELRLVNDPEDDDVDSLIHARARLAKIIQINRSAANRRAARRRT